MALKVILKSVALVIYKASLCVCLIWLLWFGPYIRYIEHVSQYLAVFVKNFISFARRFVSDGFLYICLNCAFQLTLLHLNIVGVLVSVQRVQDLFF